MHDLAAGVPAGTPAILEHPVAATDDDTARRPRIVNVVVLGDPATHVRLAGLLARETPDIRVVAHAAALPEAVGISNVLRPEIVLIARDLAPAAASDACRRLLETAPGTRVLLMGTPGADAAVGALMAGAAGFVAHDGTATDLVNAIRQAHAGGLALDAATAGAVVTRLRATRQEAPSTPSLSARQRQVLDLVAAGCSNREIAAELSLAEKTVRNYVHQLLGTLGVRSRAAAARWALERRRPAALAA